MRQKAGWAGWFRAPAELRFEAQPNPASILMPGSCSVLREPASRRSFPRGRLFGEVYVDRVQTRAARWVSGFVWLAAGGCARASANALGPTNAALPRYIIRVA